MQGSLYFIYLHILLNDTWVLARVCIGRSPCFCFWWSLVLRFCWNYISLHSNRVSSKLVLDLGFWGFLLLFCFFSYFNLMCIAPFDFCSVVMISCSTRSWMTQCVVLVNRRNHSQSNLTGFLRG